jgi:hypothetical protein
MVMVPVLFDHFARPAQGRQGGEFHGMGTSLEEAATVVSMAKGRNFLSGQECEQGKDPFEFSPYYHLRPELLQGGFRTRGTVRPNGNERPRDSPEVADCLLGDSKLRRRTSPEKIARGRRDDCKVGSEHLYPLSHLAGGQLEEMGINKEHLMAFSLEQGEGIAELEGEMGLATAEVDAPFKTPVGVDQSVSHFRPPRGED